MQESNAQKTNKSEGAPDHARIKRLVDAAGEKLGGFRQLAVAMGVTAQLVSNWRNGVKTPSPEAQAELAEIAQQNAPITAFMALIEKTEGPRKARLQASYLRYVKERSAAVEDRKSTSPSLDMLTQVIESLDKEDKTQAKAARMLQAVIEGLPIESWRKRWLAHRPRYLLRAVIRLSAFVHQAFDYRIRHPKSLTYALEGV